jgi:DNA polymerase
MPVSAPEPPAAVEAPQAPHSPSTAEANVPPASAPAPLAAASLDALRDQVAACKACALHAGRTQTVFGTGHEQAQWLLVGEGPGEEEDRRGEPFVGPAGQLLNEMLRAIGLPREAVYIANIVKCRPPGNRNPAAEEAAACLPFLRQQIALIRPRLILALGGVAAAHLLQTDAPVGRLRGQRHVLPGSGLPVAVTYHPAYLLRSPAEKRKAWQDLQFARALFAQL